MPLEDPLEQFASAYMQPISTFIIFDASTAYIDYKLRDLKFDGDAPIACILFIQSKNKKKKTKQKTKQQQNKNKKKTKNKKQQKTCGRHVEARMRR